LEGGLFFNMPLGTKLSSFNPSRPNVAFEHFVRFMVRYLATGLNVPYELLLKDFSQTNYSSARAALLEAWRYFLSCRQLFADQWLQPVYFNWLEEAVNENRIDAPDLYENAYAYTRCRWIFSGRGWVDPTKEIEAAKTRMETGLSTLEDEAAEQGRDWEETLEQRAIESQRKRELDQLYGLEGIYSLAYNPTATVKPQTAAPADNQDNPDTQDTEQEATS
jgi:lambda family phage portal protein